LTERTIQLTKAEHKSESRSTVSGLSRSRIAATERGKQLVTAQVLNLVARLLCQGLEAIRRTDT
jgi:transcriptional regulator with XRE-family HTH domain